MSIYKAKNVYKSLKFAVKGILYALRTQRNMRVHCVIAIVVLVLALFLRFTSIELSVIIFCITLVFFSELLNTSVEGLIDIYYQDKYSQVAENIKDVAAGAVLISSLGSAVIGMLLFVSKLVVIYS